MKFWEFLIQREGDRSWLPIESSEVEILEGRYRIMARSSECNQPIDIHISYLDLESVPPKRRTHKRTSRTTDQGLVAVMPFTSLRSGTWGIQCSSQALGKPWQHKIQLQVLEDTAHHVEDFEPEYATLAPDDMAEMISAVSQSSAPQSSQPQSPESLSPAEHEPTEHEEEVTVPAAHLENAIAQPPAPEEDAAMAKQEEAIASPAPKTSEPPPASAKYPIGHATPPTHTEGSQSLDAPNEAAPDTPLLPNLPIDLETLSPDLRQDIASMFETVDAMAEEILLSIGKQLNRPTPDTHSAPPEAPEASDTTPPNTPGSPPATSAVENPLGTRQSTDDARLALPNLYIVLDQESWTLQSDNTLTLTGHLERIDPTNATPEAVNLQLTVRLSDPQSGTSVCVLTQPVTLTQNTLTPFSMTFSSVDVTNAHVLLGQISLSVPEVSENTPAIAPPPLATQSFVVTVELNDLLEAIAQPDVIESLDPPLPFVEPEESVNQPDKGDRSAEPRPFRVADSSTLPPKLEPPQPPTPNAPKSRPSLDLPDFVKSSTSIASSILGLAGLNPELFGDRQAQDQGAAAPTTPPNVAQSASPAPNNAGTGRSEPTPSTPAHSEPDHPGIDPELEGRLEHAQAQSFEEALPSSSSNQYGDEVVGDRPTDDDVFSATIHDLEDEDFLANLDLPENLDFLDDKDQSPPTPQSARTAFDTPDTLAQQYIPDYAEVAPETSDTSDDINTADVPPSPSAGYSRNDYQEMVIDDDPFSDAQPKPTTHHPEPTGGTGTDAPKTYAVLPDDVGVPLPRIECLDDELVAGQPFRITVTVPNVGSRIFVKLWVQDRQTRLLLDGPRWLADFIPRGTSELETRTQLTIPLGSVEVRIEAIAMEVLTQRESHKVSIDKPVVPPDLPTISFDEFNE